LNNGKNVKKGEKILYEYLCDRCSKVHEEWHGMLEHPVVLCQCGHKCLKLISTGQMFCGVNGRADMYNFVDFNTTGKPVVINSKTQWRNHLKAHGLNDDVKNDPYTKSEIESMKRKETRKKEENRKKIKNTVIDIVRNVPSSKLRERAKKVIRKGG
jgi:DNA-directed RNA polymerase subunit RPC12/RpoP